MNTRGARALRSYLLARQLSIGGFCEAHGLSRQYISRTFRGLAPRASVDFALAIERATDGKIPAHWWASTTRKLVLEPGDDAASDTFVENVTPSPVLEALA